MLDLWRCRCSTRMWMVVKGRLTQIGTSSDPAAKWRLDLVRGCLGGEQANPTALPRPRQGACEASDRLRRRARTRWCRAGRAVQLGGAGCRSSQGWRRAGTLARKCLRGRRLAACRLEDAGALEQQRRRDRWCCRCRMLSPALRWRDKVILQTGAGRAMPALVEESTCQALSGACSGGERPSLSCRRRPRK